MSTCVCVKGGGEGGGGGRSARGKKMVKPCFSVPPYAAVQIGSEIVKNRTEIFVHLQRH